MTNSTNDKLAIEMISGTKRFHKSLAVDEVSLTVERGSILGFIGPNGAGKTTTIKMLMGLLPMDGGSAKVLGYDVTKQADDIRLRVGYVPEQHFIYRWMRVDECIRFCRALYETWNDSLCEELQDQFALPARKKVKALSKGMLVKLALLLAISHEPELLILDEPTAGLDPLIREEFLAGVLRNFTAGDGRSVLFSSHTLHDIQRVADSVAIINEGQLILQCPADDLLTRTKRIRLTLSGDSPPAGLAGMGIYQRTEGRECILTVGDFSGETVDTLSAVDGVKAVEVLDIALEEIFKDYILGRRASK